MHNNWVDTIFSPSVYDQSKHQKNSLINSFHNESLTWAFGRHLLRLFGRSEEDGLTGGAAASHADALDVDDVLCVFIQVPQSTGARGGVHLLDEPQHANILLLQMERRQREQVWWGGTQCNVILHIDPCGGNSLCFGSTSAECSRVRVKLMHQVTIWYFWTMHYIGVWFSANMPRTTVLREPLAVCHFSDTRRNRNNILQSKPHITLTKVTGSVFPCCPKPKQKISLLVSRNVLAAIFFFFLNQMQTSGSKLWFSCWWSPYVKLLPSGLGWCGVNECKSPLVKDCEKNKNVDMKPHGFILFLFFSFSGKVIKLKETEWFSDHVRSAWNVHYYPAKTVCSGQLVPVRSRASLMSTFIYQAIKVVGFLSLLKLCIHRRCCWKTSPTVWLQRTDFDLIMMRQSEL